jgi:hypothetical protein
MSILRCSSGPLSSLIDCDILNTINICCSVCGCRGEYRYSTLVTPTKHGGYRQLTARGVNESGRAAPAVLGRAASSVVRPGRGVVSLGWGQQREDQVFHVISQLNHRYAAEIKNITNSTTERDPYTTLRTEILRRLSPSLEQRIRQLLTLEKKGDRKPPSS